MVRCESWSEYGNGADDQSGYGCGGEGGDAYWYMGRTQCFRANAAYSLYGVKAGANPSRESGCGIDNYINSFFTYKGIESFADPLGIDYESYSASSRCTYQQVDDGDGDGDGGNNNGDNNNDNNKKKDENHYGLSGEYVSYGTGCSKKGEFILAQFDGAYCDGTHFQATTDDLQTLNSNFEALGCIQVFGSDDNDGDKDNNNGDKNDNNNNNNNDNGDAENSIAYQLLEYSMACSVVEYPTRCPDPFGIKRRRDTKLYKEATIRFRRAVPPIMPILSTLFCIGAVILGYLGEKNMRAAQARSGGLKRGFYSLGPKKLVKSLTGMLSGRSSENRKANGMFT